MVFVAAPCTAAGVHGDLDTNVKIHHHNVVFLNPFYGMRFSWKLKLKLQAILSIFIPFTFIVVKKAL